MTNKYQKRYVKHPDEVTDYTIPFSKWLAEENTTAVSIYTDVAAGLIEVSSAILANGDANVRLAGGISGRSYDAGVGMTASDGQVKRIDILIRVRGKASFRQSGQLYFGNDVMYFGTSPIGFA